MATVTLSFGGKEVKTYDLAKQATVVGRDPGADIVIDNLGVSRSHCQLIRRGAAFVVQDMNSANGTYVNGKKVGEHSLIDSDQIVVGKYVLTFKLAGGSAVPAVATAPAADRIVPDSLNTYMMDGNKIKERIEEMRREEQGKVSPAAPAPAVRAAAPAPAAAERPSRIVMSGPVAGGLSAATLKRYLYLSLALNVVLALAFALLYYFFLTHTPS
jgi:pSer/pThr/pTyr-binding forkhead associated (FHA) protein